MKPAKNGGSYQFGCSENGKRNRMVLDCWNEALDWLAYNDLCDLGDVKPQTTQEDIASTRAWELLQRLFVIHWGCWQWRAYSGKVLLSKPIIAEWDIIMSVNWPRYCKAIHKQLDIQNIHKRWQNSMYSKQHINNVIPTLSALLNTL
jgi:hypothetical protein